MAIRCDNPSCPVCHPPLPDRACDRCAVKLESVFPEPNRYPQYLGALHIDLYGGYGEYIDLMPPFAMPGAVLCRPCVEALRAAEPWFERLLAAYFAGPLDDAPPTAD